MHFHSHLHLPLAASLIAAASTPATTGNTGPDPTDWDINPGGASVLPGGNTLSSLASGVGHWALIAAVLGVIIGGVMWAFGHFSHNYQQSFNGRKGVIVSGIAALLIGGAQKIIGFFFNQGVTLH
ncbi:MAG TPA: DUF6112 family protein [Acidimicrobiales bacterium]|nr:DUF6112 family protein [Acidimicrobiales bacterium]